MSDLLEPAEAYSEPSRTSEMEIIAKSIFDVRLGSEHASDLVMINLPTKATPIKCFKLKTI